MHHAGLPAPAGSRDVALKQALERLEPAQPERPSRPGGAVVTAVRRLPEIAARFGEFPRGVDERLIRALKAHGVERPYSHQAEAIGHALAGHHVVVVTPTV